MLSVRYGHTYVIISAAYSQYGIWSVNMRDWKPLIEQLSRSFQENEERLRILHELDQQVLNFDLRLEDLCASVLANVMRFSSADLGYFYIYNETELLLLCSMPPFESVHPIRIDDARFKTIPETSRLIFEAKLDMSDSPFPPIAPESVSRIIVPIDYDGRLWGLMGLESFGLTKLNPLDNDDIHEFLEIVRRQLEIAVRFRTQHKDLEQLSRIQNELFGRELDIAESLDSLISNITFALPNIGPLAINPLPEIQILFYREGEEYLTIRATTGSEPINTRVYVADSVSGSLIERPELPYYLCDPRNEPGRYRSYLGKDEKGAKRKEIRTELVVPIRYENRLIGIINLESELEGVFKIPHVRAMEHLAEQVSPIVNALQKRMEKTRVQARANVYAMKKFLDRFALAYDHKMGTPIAKVSLKLGNLKAKIESTKKEDELSKTELLTRLQGCIDFVDDIDSYHHEFSGNLPRYLIFGRYPLNSLIKSATQDLKPVKLKEKDDIDVIFEPERDYEVFCSLFLREHIYNLLNNSVYAIRERKKGEVDLKGQILIESFLEVDEEEEKLNKRCRIRIWDNGIGLDEEKLSRIPDPFTTKPSGTGFGLSAAFQYLRGLGGGLKVASKAGKFFEVNMYLDLYTKEVHGALDTFLDINGEVE